jgi:hypothetical protein
MDLENPLPATLNRLFQLKQRLDGTILASRHVKP